MPDNDRLIYPSVPRWRGPETVILNAAVSVFFAFFAVPGIVAIVGGLAAGTPEPVFFGIFWSVVYGRILWTYFHLASSLEFSGGYLSWRSSLPWLPKMRPGRVSAVRWPVARRYLGIELDDGRKMLVMPGPGLMEFINRVHEAEPAIVIEFRSDAGQRWARAERASYFQQRLQAAGAHRSLRIPASIVAAVVLVGFVLLVSQTFIGGQENFQTLRGDLGKVHLPAGYHLVATRQAGTDCAHGSCSLMQTWAWTLGNGHSSGVACADVQRALSSAFSGVDSNSPIPANAACDYYAIVDSFFHPGQGKRTVEAIVDHCQATMTDGCVIRLTASYG